MMDIEKVYEGKDRTHFRLQGVTVRVGFHGVYLCLTCVSTTCKHAELVRDFDTSKESAA